VYLRAAVGDNLTDQFEILVGHFFPLAAVKPIAFDRTAFR
jgi:hypothetical protein